VKKVGDKVLQHSLAYLSMQKLVEDIRLKVNFLVKVNHPLAREQMPAMRITSKITRISDLIQYI